MQLFVESQLFLFQLFFSSFVVFRSFLARQEAPPSSPSVQQLVPFWRGRPCPDTKILTSQGFTWWNPWHFEYFHRFLHNFCYLLLTRTKDKQARSIAPGFESFQYIENFFESRYDIRKHFDYRVIESNLWKRRETLRLDRISKAEGLASKSVAQCVPWLNFPENRLKQKSKPFQNSSKFYFY